LSKLINIPFPEGVNSDAPVSKLEDSESPIIRNVMTRYLPTQVIPRNGIPVVTSWSLALDGTDQWAEADGWFPYFAAPSHDGRTFLIGTTDGTCKWAPYYQPTDLPDYKDDFLYKKGYGFIEVDLTIEPDPNDPYDPSYNMSYGTWKSGGDKGIQANFWGQWAHYDGMTFICAAADTVNGTATVKYAAKFSDPASTTKGQSQSWNYAALPGAENILPLAFLQAWSGRVTISASTSRNESVTITPTAEENKYSTKISAVDSKYVGRIAWHAAGTAKPLTHYEYKIKSTTHFERPYLLGLKKDEGPTSTNMIGEYAPVVHAPIGSHTLAVFRERVFGARGHISQTWADTLHQGFPEAIEGVGGYYGNAVVWSQPGAPTKWPTTNYAIVDNDDADPITAMYAMDDALYIFKATRTYRMVGYDEESFSVEKVSNVVGCPYPNGVTAYEGTMYFVSDDAVYSMTNGELENLTVTGSGKGISNLLAERPWALHKSRQQELQGTPMYEHYWPTVAVTPDGHLLMCCQDIKGGYDPLKLTDNFCYDIATGTWSEWGYYNKALNPMRVLQGPTGRVYGIHHSFMTELTDVWNPTAKQLPVYDEVPNLTPEYLHWYEAPDMYTGDIWIGRQWQMEMLKSALTRTPVPVQMDVYVSSPGSTTRINEMQIDHGIYAEAEYIKPTWQVSFASDPDMREVIDTHTIKPRVKGKADTVGLDEYHFSDRLLNTFQREGQTIRIVFTCLTDITDNPPESYRLYNVFMVAEQVRTLGVDNSPTK